MIVRPWEIGDTEKVELQDSQRYVQNLFNLSADLSFFSENDHCFTFEHDGEILAIALCAPLWEGRAEATMLISKDAGKHFKFIHKRIVEIMDNLDYRRYEATVDIGFKEGHRWMKLLGFEIEGYMRKYRPDGADMVLYARVK